MSYTNVLRRLRPCIVSQPFSNIDVRAVRHGGPFTVCGFRAVSQQQLTVHAVRRSSLKLPSNNKVQSHCLSARSLLTEASSEDGNLIYTGSLGRAVRGVKLFSYSTSGTSLFLMPQILLKTGLGVESLALQVAFCGVIGFFTIVTPVLLHLFTRGYVIRLYHNPDTDTYTAITYSVFLTEKKSVFHQRQVKIPAVSKMFSTFTADRMGLLVNPDLFPFPHDYNHLMGYDKPFTFDTDNMNRPDES
ncbi:transmembrane protein 70, mitochondrial [Dicentrarchus labrax]|uniref:Transmembrane protein 70 n=1 Tax=Dicentrarchus labrax TaxID=13489 RepID=A0A8C4D8J2_DICLA|nr:transmembrane protein 70, mitochondrial [Dicentrarchus labrax]